MDVDKLFGVLVLGAAMIGCTSESHEPVVGEDAQTAPAEDSGTADAGEAVVDSGATDAAEATECFCQTDPCCADGVVMEGFVCCWGPCE